MACSLLHVVEEIQVYVQKQCDEDDAARQEAIMGVITLFEQAMATKEDLKKQYAECKDILPERRVVIQKFLDDEAWRDYEVKKTFDDLLEHILGKSNVAATTSDPVPPTAECLGSPLSNEDVVNTVLEGLPAKYDYVYGIIVHQEPFPDLKTVRSMLTTEEMRLKSRAPTTSFDSTSSPMVLLANFGNSTRRSNVTTKKKILESPWGSPIPIGDGDGDVKQFLDGNGGGDRE
ncbi:hypothetical protein Tco_0776748 [Tanacetum coccineum]